MYSYVHVKTLTEQLLEDALALLDMSTPCEAALTQNHPLIRVGDDYADLFALGAQQSATVQTAKTGETP